MSYYVGFDRVDALKDKGLRLPASLSLIARREYETAPEAKAVATACSLIWKSFKFKVYEQKVLEF